MGGAHSRARPGVGPARIRSTKLGAGGKHAAELAAAASGQRGQGRLDINQVSSFDAFL